MPAPLLPDLPDVPRRDGPRMGLRRWVAHLDMDAFYASVELLRYPELRGQPVVIGGSRDQQPQQQADGSRRFAELRHYVGRGVVTTATYEARALGVHSAMGMMKAAALAPHAVLLPVDFEQYRHYSRRFKAAVAAIAPVIEDRGIDEIYIDLTEVPGAQDGAATDPLAGVRALARRLKDAVHEATGLVCSIGVSPNKLLSKLGSDLDKPDGLTVLTPEDIPTRIWPLPARRINGIGPKAEERLAARGLHTIGELAAAPIEELVEAFGSNYGQWLHEAAHGRDDRPVVTWQAPKSISRETTFERNLLARTDRAQLGEIFTRLCERLAQDLQRKGYRAGNIGVKVRYDDFRIVSREISLPEATADAATIRLWAGRCLRKVPLEQALRLLGVRAGHLLPEGELAADAGGEGARMPPQQFDLPLFDLSNPT